MAYYGSFLFIIILVIIIGAIARVMKSNLGSRLFAGKRIRWFVGGYAVILLICSGLSPLLSNDGTTFKTVDNNQDFEGESSQLFDSAMEGNIKKIDSEFIKKTWNFNFEEKELIVEFADPEMGNGNEAFFTAPLIVERKTVNDGKVEAIHIKGRSSVNNLDITDLEKPLRIDLGGNKIILMNPEKLELKFSQFQHAFPVNQFTGQNQFGASSNFNEGINILYLKIPKNLKLVNKSDIEINYVE